MDTLPLKVGTAEIILSARQGNLEAFNRLVGKYQESVFNLAYRILGDETSAAEATQAAFLTAYHRLPGYSDGSFRVWLLRQAARACCSKKARSVKLPLQRNGASRQAVSLETCLQGLALELRLVVALVDLEGLTYEEAAAALEISVNQVRSRLALARQQLTRLYVIR